MYQQSMKTPVDGRKVRIGIIGLGYWGPNLTRVLGSLRDCEVTAICDRCEDRLQQFEAMLPGVKTFRDAQDILSTEHVDAIVIATPTTSHFSLASAALERGIHTFVEKPLATSAIECEQLIQLAAAKDLILFVGHVALYSAPVRKLKELLDSGDIGELTYISSTRLNLGPVRYDVNALWDLAPHDISIMLYLMGGPPVSVSCSGLAYLNQKVHDVCSLTLNFENNRMGIIHVSWLDPHKRRLLTMVGNKRMVIYDDIDPLEKIKVYDRGVEAPSYSDTFGEFHFSYRYGDTYSPRLIEAEPLKVECQSFVESILEGKQPLTDGRNGLEVVRVMEAADHSLHNGNGRVELIPKTRTKAKRARGRRQAANA
jgi:predicted dehydrogenase